MNGHLSVCMSVCTHDNLSNSGPIEMKSLFFLVENRSVDDEFEIWSSIWGARIEKVFEIFFRCRTQILLYLNTPLLCSQ